MPELATSVIAVRKKQVDIAIGNVVGSNIFNIFWILGFSSIIQPLPFGNESNIALMMTILASAILFIILFIGKRQVIEKWQGALMIVIYILYLFYSIIG